MTQDTYKEQLGSLLPEHSGPNETQPHEQQALLQEASSEHQAHTNAATLARMKLREKQELRKLQRKQEKQASLASAPMPTPAPGSPTPTPTPADNKELERVRENITEIQLIEDSPEAQNFLAEGYGNTDLSPYSGTTKREVVKLMQSLNINLNLNLTQADTYNLLGCLLTCNERQLQALYSNSKIPLAIKTVIKRMMEDAKLGNIETVEKLWDRIFGKAPKAELQMPMMQQQPQITQGIIPNTVVSREAYMIIRDTIIGK